MQEPAPSLLRTATYNRYFSTGNWRYDPPPSTSQEEDFNGLLVVGEADRELKSTVDEFLYRSVGAVPPGQEARADLPTFTMRGEVKAGTLLPLPGAVHTVYLSAQDLEKNTIGSIRITPRHAVLQATVRWNGEFDSDGAVFEGVNDETSVDLAVPVQERAVLKGIAESLALENLTFGEKIVALRAYFTRNFSYSSYLTIQSKADRSGGKTGSINGRDSALAKFLLEEKTGHCEYFATATTLLLRSAGVKARYCVGLSVQEKNPKTGEYVLRGTHGHAWCRAWNETTQRWVDVDLTPPTWFSVDQPSDRWQQGVTDFLQLMREDFTVWRTQPQNQRGVLVFFSVAGLAVLTWIARSLWKTRSRVGQSPHRSEQPKCRTPLSDLDRWLGKKIGMRPQGMPYALWLRRLGDSVDPLLLDEVVAAHNRLRYDPAPGEPALRARLQVLCRNLKALLR